MLWAAFFVLTSWEAEEPEDSHETDEWRLNFSSHCWCVLVKLAFVMLIHHLPLLRQHCFGVWMQQAGLLLPWSSKGKATQTHRFKFSSKPCWTCSYCCGARGILVRMELGSGGGDLCCCGASPTLCYLPEQLTLGCYSVFSAALLFVMFLPDPKRIMCEVVTV